MVDTHEKMNEFQENQISQKKIDIYNRQGRGRKKLTDVYGIPDDIDLELIKKVWTKEFHCMVQKKIDNKTKAEYMQLNGEHKEEIKKFLIEEGIGTEENIEIHEH